MGKRSKGTVAGAAAAAASAASVAASRDDCPADVEVLGRHTWTFLHTTAAYYPAQPSSSQQSAMRSLLTALPTLYPCGHCANHLKTELRPADVDEAVTSRERVSRYLCGLHNQVNERLGKDRFNCDRVDERWKDGPADGRCD